jgi:hypothetical protein
VLVRREGLEGIFLQGTVEVWTCVRRVVWVVCWFLLAICDVGFNEFEVAELEASDFAKESTLAEMVAIFEL